MPNPETNIPKGKRTDNQETPISPPHVGAYGPQNEYNTYVQETLVNAGVDLKLYTYSLKHNEPMSLDLLNSPAGNPHHNGSGDSTTAVTRLQADLILFESNPSAVDVAQEIDSISELIAATLRDASNQSQKAADPPAREQQNVLLNQALKNIEVYVQTIYPLGYPGDIEEKPKDIDATNFEIGVERAIGSTFHKNLRTQIIATLQALIDRGWQGDIHQTIFKTGKATAFGPYREAFTEALISANANPIFLKYLIDPDSVPFGLAELWIMNRTGIRPMNPIDGPMAGALVRDLEKNHPIQWAKALRALARKKPRLPERAVIRTVEVLTRLINEHHPSEPDTSVVEHLFEALEAHILTLNTEAQKDELKPLIKSVRTWSNNKTKTGSSAIRIIEHVDEQTHPLRFEFGSGSKPVDP